MNNTADRNLIQDHKGKNLVMLMSKASLFFFYSIFFFISFAPGQVFLIFTILFLITTWIAYGNPFKSTWVKLYPLIWLGIYFAMHVVWLVGTENLKQGMSDIERHISFIIFLLATPIIFRHTNRVHLTNGYKIFIASCLMVSIVSLIFVLYKNFEVNRFEVINIENYTNHDLLVLFDLHATYFSLSVMIACLLLFDIFNNGGEKHSTTEIIFYLVIIIVFVLTLYLLRSRIVILAGLVVMIYTSLNSKVRRVRIASILLLSALILILGFSLSYDKAFRTRTLEFMNIDFSQLMGTNAENGVTQRIFLWQRSMEAIRDAPLLGYGTGDLYDVVTSQIEIFLRQQNLTGISRKAIESFIINPYNPHNQFMADTIKFGFLGFVISLVFFGNGFAIAIRASHMPFIGFIILTFFACLTECILVRQKGLDLFCFFYVVFTLEVKRLHSHLRAPVISPNSNF